MNGWQFLGELSNIALDRRSEICIVSFSVDPVDVNRGQNSDKIRGYLIKPLKSNQLEKILFI
ncbi:hypothetical protein LPB144_11590 [Christiangramia salexigens]|uniref:Response regulatory domain-containing protein n=1 Tax=Christiangramia salexigens TaxID=1913577 RepID=A0A1L3J7B1_9FLAO|nr:hypothetical protein LPB144_11590 [Christiangramia salexigens]